VPTNNIVEANFTPVREGSTEQNRYAYRVNELRW